MALRGKELNEKIEQILQLMLAEGLDTSPISAKAVYDKLIEQKYISGGLSTLSKSERKGLIERYRMMQLEDARLTPEAKHKLLRKQNKDAYKQRYLDAKDKISQLNNELEQNTSVLIDIIEAVEATTPIPVERLLTPHLLKTKIKRIQSEKE